MVEISIVHPKIAGGNIVEGGDPVRVQLKSVEEALAYYSEHLEEPIAKRVGAFYEEKLQVLGIDPASIGVDLRGDPHRVLSAPTFGAVETAMREEGFSLWENPFATHFFRDINKGGYSFYLGSIVTKVDWDVDLSRRNFISTVPRLGNWDNKISSVDTGILVVATILCDLPYFGGSKLILFSDDNDLTNNYTDHGVSWNDRTSSCATGTVPLTAILAAIGL